MKYNNDEYFVEITDKTIKQYNLSLDGFEIEDLREIQVLLNYLTGKFEELKKYKYLPYNDNKKWDKIKSVKTNIANLYEALCRIGDFAKAEELLTLFSDEYELETLTNAIEPTLNNFVDDLKNIGTDKERISKLKKALKEYYINKLPTS